MTLEIEAPRFGRARGGEQMASRHDAQAGLRGDAGIVLQRNADAARSGRWRHPVQPDPIQSQARCTRGGAVDKDYPPLDRTVIAVAQDRTGYQLRASLGDEDAQHGTCQQEWDEAKAAAPEKGGEQQASCNEAHYDGSGVRWLHRESEINANPGAKGQSQPRKSVPAQ